jgi:hypothetical protein
MLITANDFGTIFLAIELQSLSLYMLAGFKKNSIYTLENGQKYFILGALSAAYFLLGLEYFILSFFICLFVEGYFLMPPQFFEKVGAILLNCSQISFVLMPRKWIPDDSCLGYTLLAHVLQNAIFVLDVLEQLLLTANVANGGEFNPEDLRSLFKATKEGVKQLFRDAGFHSNLSGVRPLSSYYRTNDYWQKCIIYKGKPCLPKELIRINGENLYKFQEALMREGRLENAQLIDATRAVLLLLDAFLSDSIEEKTDFFGYRPNRKKYNVEDCYLPLRKYVKEYKQKVLNENLLFLAIFVPVYGITAFAFVWRYAGGKWS